MCESDTTKMAEIDGKAVADMKVVELKVELEKRGLSKSGLKQQLINRLVKWVDNQEGKAAPPSDDGPPLPDPAPVAEAAAAQNNNDDDEKKDAVEEKAEDKEDVEEEDEVDVKDRVPCTKLCKPPLPGADNAEASLCPNRRFGKMRKKMGDRTILACVEVERLLKLMGVNPNRSSRCVLAGIQCGAIKITGKKEELKQVIFEGSGEVCDCKIPVVLGQVLKQADWGGDQYELEDSNVAKVHCKRCRRSDRWWGHFYFATQLCQDDPMLNSGKFFNHCRKCPDYGICLGDYRDTHCDLCGAHGYRGSCFTEGCANADDDDDSEDDVEAAIREVQKRQNYSYRPNY